MANLRKWASRLEYFAIVSILLIIAGNALFFVQTGDSERIFSFKGFVVSYLNSMNMLLFNLEDYQRSLLVVASLLVLLLFLVSRRREILPFLTLLLGNMIFIPYLFNRDIFGELKFFFIENHEVFATFSAIGICSILIALTINKVGRAIIFQLVRFLVEFYVLGTLLYYFLTSRNSELVAIFQAVWSELSFSIHYMEVYIDIISISFIVIVISSIHYSTLLGVINWLRRKFVLRARRNQEIDGSAFPHVGVTIPAFNEEDVIIPTIEAALSSVYPKNRLDIIVVCDGSEDKTLERLLSHFDMRLAYQYKDFTPTMNLLETKKVKSVWYSRRVPNLKVVLKENGGKHDALNCGLNFHQESVTHVMHLDADTILDEHAIYNLAAEIVYNESEVIAVSGTILPEYRSSKINGLKDWFKKKRSHFLVEWQRVDYITSFHVHRGGLSLTNSMLIISGAFGLFERQSLFDLFGYRKGLGEDMDLTLNLQHQRLKTKRKGKILFIPDAVAYTAAPLTMKELANQRKRWFKGLLESLFRFKSLAFTRISINYILFAMVEFIAPLSLPIGIINLMIRPEMIYSPVFQVMVLVFISSYMVSSFVGLLIEKQYREVKISSFFFVITQFIMMPLTLIWRNDAFIQYNDKSWGVIKKSFK